MGGEEKSGETTGGDDPWEGFGRRSRSSIDLDG